ncbi:MAG TPA: PA0069 family radical SAM protein [Planctomycetota bacterium]|nr:PA0069 family radical SAM protein [Planctomycetota bacterium]
MTAKRVSNPPNPWVSAHVEWLDEVPVAEVEVFEEEAKSVLAENKSPDLGFRWSVNPYRGCHHACAYCYARPSHQYLGFGAGTDFDRKIVVKVNAPAVLARELSRPKWKRELVVFSGNTDCYQPLDAHYGLTRGCLEACLAHGTPVGVITKGALVRRDVDVLAKLARGPGASAAITIPFANEDVARRIEPGAPSPRKRFETMRALSDAGVPTTIAIAPLVPGLNESDIPELLARAKESGATSAFLTLLRLSAEVLPVFRERIAEAFPERAKHIESAILDVRGGRMNRSDFGDRMKGRGPRWDAVARMFEIHCRRNGIAVVRGAPGQAKSAPTPKQGEMFA